MSAFLSRPPISAWVLTFAAVGFCAGFFGPIVLNPAANQGPMLGIFITGPGGLILGAVVGVLARWFAIAWRGLFVLAALYGLIVLYMCLPPPAAEGDVFQVRVLSCRSPSELVPDAMAHWEQRIAAVTWHPPRDGWKQQLVAAAREDHGRVIEAIVIQQHRVLRHRKPWSFGRLTVQSITDANAPTRFYTADACAINAAETRTYFARANQTGSGWPPTELPNLLNLRVLEPVPERYAKLLRE